ncbi:MAG: aminopeptidase, partial [Lachnospiraceae bacterium]|nr:aminopeptidase [Lachnospiraceae bacterium]
PNKQYEYDHREDEALFLDKKMANRRLEVQKEAYETYKTLSGLHAGPAWVEVFGEKPFTPQICPDAPKLSKKQQEISTWYYGQLGQLINEYIPGEERSFTIIAFPIPEIGPKYEEIMTETIRLNTLDYVTYEKIQQSIIDALDTCEYVKIEGANGNQTNLKVMLTDIENPDKQTKFENCVADVNIPVGEVFTSPKLTGTEGTLHVSKVYLREFEYKDLTVVFKDGKITEYSCANFENPEEGKKLITENVLYHHESLPMGEFAIGTNTTAYRMGRAYGIEDRLPILIAEKTGPHFAVGDTCYSHAEDVAVYNADGKEIIARDNEISLLRKSDPEKAYFQCHTDITIPYDELGALYGVTGDGKEVKIIEAGRFVLPGTEELNRALEEA